jgi:hypothetical protein
MPAIREAQAAGAKSLGKIAQRTADFSLSRSSGFLRNGADGCAWSPALALGRSGAELNVPRCRGAAFR